MNLDQIFALAKEHDKQLVTLQIPQFPSAPQKQGNTGLVKKAIATARELIEQQEASESATRVLAQLDQLFDKIDFMRHARTILVFVNKSAAQIFYIDYELPEMVKVNASYYIRDILTSAQLQQNYWVLVLSQKPSRLLRGKGPQLEEIIEPVRDNLGIERDGFPFDYIGVNDHHVQAIAAGDRDSHYKDDHLKVFYKKVDKLLHKFIQQKPLPIIVVGDQQDISYFEEVTQHKQYIAQHVIGAYNLASPADIARVVQPALKAYQDQLAQDALEEYLEAVSKAKHAFGVEWVWKVAHEGQVHKLLVEENFKISGSISTNYPPELTILPTNNQKVYEDVVALIIQTVLEKGGQVIFVSPGFLKDYQHIVAILRY